MPEPTDDESRWAAARSVLDRAPDQTARQRLRRQRTVSWLVIAGVVAVGLGVGALVVVLLGGHRHADPPQWREVTSLVLSSVGLVVLVVGAVLGWRAGVWRGVWSQPAAVLSRPQRRALLAQVRGRAPVEPARLPLARSLAERLLLQRHLLLFWVGLLLQQIGRAVGSTSVLDVALTAVGSVGFLAALVLLGREARRAERFLLAHPEPRPPDPAG